MSLVINPITAARRILGDAKLSLVYFEAIANSIDAEADDIRITVRLNEVGEWKTFSIVISDNGKGIDKEGFDRFSEVFKSKDKAHKGQGRLAYLANFDSTKVSSSTQKESREFDFDEHFDAKKGKPVPNTSLKPGTRLELKTYAKDKVHDYSFIRPASVVELVLAEFYPRFYSMKLQEKKLVITIALEITEESAKHDLLRSVEVLDISRLPVLSEVDFDASPALMHENMKLYYHIDTNYDKGKLLICGFNIDGRSYKVDAIRTDNLPINTRGIFLLSSPYFDGRSDGTRQKAEIDDNIIRGLQRRMAEEIDILLKKEIPSINESNEVTRNEVRETFPHLEGYFPVETAGLVNRNDLIERATEVFVRDQRKVLEAEHLTDEQLDKALEMSARVLMEYVLYRNKTLDRLAAMDIVNTEYEIHDLIVPRRRVYNGGHPASIYTNNAWVLDDKFMTYSKILSEAELADVIAEISDEKIDGDVSGRPDIAMIFSEEVVGGKQVDLVVVEIKKRDTKLKEQENVISQLRQRARRILRRYDGKIRRMWFYGVTDISQEMSLIIAEEKWIPLFSSGPMWYQERLTLPIDSDGSDSGVPVGYYVMPYITMIADARRRNSTFMDLLRHSISGRPE
ncbi:MAG: ATP-binding protein [Flavobacteriales bacterium]